MLQPKSYPEMLGKALVFEAEPFMTMVDDDNPWAEGLFMVVLMGVLVGLAQIVGVLLTAAIMPDSEALLTALLAGLAAGCRAGRSNDRRGGRRVAAAVVAAGRRRVRLWLELAALGLDRAGAVPVWLSSGYCMA